MVKNLPTIDYESADGGESWSRLMDGLRHRYLVGLAVDPGDADTVVASAARGPSASYRPRGAEAYVYRKSAGGPFELAMEGLPAAEGPVASQTELLHNHERGSTR